MTHSTQDCPPQDCPPCGQSWGGQSWGYSPEFMTIFVAWQLRVTLDSIRNSCDVFDWTYLFETAVCDRRICGCFRLRSCGIHLPSQWITFTTGNFEQSLTALVPPWVCQNGIKMGNWVKSSAINRKKMIDNVFDWYPALLCNPEPPVKQES